LRKEPLAAHGNAKPGYESRGPAPAPDSIDPDELRRDQRVFRALRRHGLGDDTKRALFAAARGHGRTYMRKDYDRFQRRLLALAEKAGVSINIYRKAKAEQPGDRAELEDDTEGTS
jgi:hypothetical protein